MKNSAHFLAIVSFACFATALCTQNNTKEQSSVWGIFVGTSPCGNMPRPLLKIPGQAVCDRISWHLTFYQDPSSLVPTSYKLTSEYGYHIDNRTFSPQGTITIEGTWRIMKGAKLDPNAEVYELRSEDDSTISFLKLNNDLLHLLNRDKSLMIGNGGQSYTLSRANR